MINSGKLLSAAVLLAFAAYTQADDLTDAARGLCDTVKSCALEQIAKEDMTPEMRQMMEPMLDSMCVNMQSRVGEVPTGHGLYAPAVACMRSMESMTCQQMQDAQRVETPECQKYEQLAKESGVLQQ